MALNKANLVPWNGIQRRMRLINGSSTSANTTASVVTAITMVILVDAIMAIMTRDMGLF